MTKSIISFVLMLLISISVVFSGCSYQNSSSIESDDIRSTRPTLSSEDEVGIISSLFIPTTLDDLISDAECIVLGEVIEILPSIDANYGGNQIICTEVVFQVDKNFLDTETSNKIIIRVDGGRIEKRVMVSEEEAEFILGNQYLVFLYSPTNIDAVPTGFEKSDYYGVKAGYMGNYEYDNGNLTDFQGSTLSIEEIEQKVSTIRQIK